MLINPLGQRKQLVMVFSVTCKFHIYTAGPGREPCTMWCDSSCTLELYYTIQLAKSTIKKSEPQQRKKVLMLQINNVSCFEVCHFSHLHNNTVLQNSPAHHIPLEICVSWKFISSGKHSYSDKQTIRQTETI